MTLLIDTTIGGEFSNSYTDVDFADDFFEVALTPKATAWAALTDDQKELLLMQATQLIEQFRFVYPVTREWYRLIYDRVGQRVISFYLTRKAVRLNFLQKLQFPRNLDVDSLGVSFIPEPVKIATCELALSLSTSSDESITKILGGIKSEEVEIAGQIRKAVTYQDAATISSSTTTTAGIPPIALQYLSPYMINSSRLERV